MPWRQKPASWLRYWDSGTPSGAKAAGFKTILVYCVGLADMRTTRDRCYHNSRLKLDDLPEWRWQDISAHLKCTKCGTVGYVDTRPDWCEVINFNKGIRP
jgi:hypothetical protein